MKNWCWFLISAGVILIDQITKIWANATLLAYQPKPLIPMVNLTLVFNKGAAFSLLSQAGGWQRWILAGFSLFMSVVLLIWISRTQDNERWQKFGLSLILGGAIGNLIDRAFFGYVVDFIDVYYKNYHWPVFNIADTAISIGAVILLLDLFFDRTSKNNL